jgi:hypothetical protein
MEHKAIPLTEGSTITCMLCGCLRQLHFHQRRNGGSDAQESASLHILPYVCITSWTKAVLSSGVWAIVALASGGRQWWARQRRMHGSGVWATVARLRLGSVAGDGVALLCSCRPSRCLIATLPTTRSVAAECAYSTHTRQNAKRTV